MASGSVVSGTSASYSLLFVMFMQRAFAISAGTGGIFEFTALYRWNTANFVQLPESHALPVRPAISGAALAPAPLAAAIVNRANLVG